MKSSNKADIIGNKKTQVYNELKKWDTERGNLLQFHLKMVNHVLTNLDSKTKASKQYMNYIEGLMVRRLKQLEKYIENGLTKSEFCLGKNTIKSYSLHHQVLKELMLHQGQRQLQLEGKYKRLKTIFNEFRALREQNGAEKEDSQTVNNHTNTEMEGSSLLILKYNVRQLIDCQLPQTMGAVMQSCKRASQVYRSDGKQDLHLAISDLILHAHEQELMHKKIGKQLISLVNSFIQRELSTNKRLKETLVKWLEEEQKLNDGVRDQLLRKNDDALIEDFYRIDDMLADFKYEHRVHQPLQDFLQNFTFQGFDLHQELVLCQYEGFYNQKIQISVIVTLDSHVHLKKYSQAKPDFSFVLQKGIQFKKMGDFGLHVSHKKRTYLFKTETEFQFTLQFNTEQDLKNFKKTVSRISDCTCL